MTEQRVQRRLAAILAADVVGYSALMQRAEEATYAEFERRSWSAIVTVRSRWLTGQSRSTQIYAKGAPHRPDF